MRKTFCLMLFTVMIITACQPKTKTTSDDIDAIRNIENQWAIATKTKDINEILSLLVSDAVEMPPNEPIAVGTEAIKKGWELWFSDTAYIHNAYTFRIDTIEVSASGDFGYVRGINHYSIKTQNGIAEYDDKYISIYKKKDGEWKCVVSIWNDDKPMAGK